jgi:chorismate dehydratase
MKGQRKLKIGKITYANIFPIFYMLQRYCDCSAYEFVESVPAQLNAKLRSGELDISPSSSIEYLRNQGLYRYIDGLSISSYGPVGSVFLFSRIAFENLSGCTIALTNQSATSIALLNVLLRQAGITDVTFVSSDRAEIVNSEAFLLIGDDALVFHTRMNHSSNLFVYDLGDLWYQSTGLPFVFALWIVRKDLPQDDVFQHCYHGFVQDVLWAKKEVVNHLPEIAAASPLAGKLSEEELLDYWKKIDYELDTAHLRGLECFRQLDLTF